MPKLMRRGEVMPGDLLLHDKGHLPTPFDWTAREDSHTAYRIADSSVLPPWPQVDAVIQYEPGDTRPIPGPRRSASGSGLQRPCSWRTGLST